jgi:hypothetical protein
MLGKIMQIYKSSDLVDFLREGGFLDFDWNREIRDTNLGEKWRFVGDNASNASSIQILNESEKGIIERLSNAIDSIFEYNKNKYALTPKKAEDVLKVAFPNFYRMRNNVLQGKLSRANVSDAANLVALVANDGDSSIMPTFDVIDYGIGIRGEDFATTILSLQGQNKIRTKENYLIGSFGQGGSTSLKFASSTLIISKKDGKYYFTVTHKLKIRGYKKPIHAYLVQDQSAIEVELEEGFDVDTLEDEHLKQFVASESGTIVRMFDYEINKKLRSNDITKPLGLLSYINTELYNIPLPIKLVDLRKNVLVNVHAQARYSYGSLMKMMTSDNNIKEYNGEFEIQHQNKIFKVNYYVILPSDEEDWANDSICSEKFLEFSHHGKSLFYTVNGQYITHEHYTKIRNRGLMYLEHRLMVEINLDQLEDKYDYFTSDRNQVIQNDVSRGLLEKVIAKLVTTDKLLELNNRIAEMTTKSKIDSEIIHQISEEVKNDYLDLLSVNNKVILKPKPDIPPKPKATKEYLDEIEFLQIDNKKSVFEKDERKSIFLSTGAKKYINNLHKNNVYTFIRTNGEYKSKELLPKIMNGTMIYDLELFEEGQYSIYFENFELELKSNIFDFQVVENVEDKAKQDIKNKLNLDINPIDDATKDFVCQVSRNVEGKIEYLNVVINFGHPDMLPLIRGKSEEATEKFKQDNIKPIALYVLLMRDDYNNISDIKLKNRMIISLVKSIN